MWNTSKGRKWAVVAFWGTETSTEFFRDDKEAEEAYEEAMAQGADVFLAEIKRMRKNKT